MPSSQLLCFLLENFVKRTWKPHSSVLEEATGDSVTLWVDADDWLGRFVTNGGRKGVFWNREEEWLGGEIKACSSLELRWESILGDDCDSVGKVEFSCTDAKDWFGGWVSLFATGGTNGLRGSPIRGLIICVPRGRLLSMETCTLHKKIFWFVPSGWNLTICVCLKLWQL